MEDEKILTQDEDELEKEMRNIEEEEKEEEVEKPSVKKPKEEETIDEGTTETYEGFGQPPRLGIVNTITGDVIEGFDPGRDEGIIQLGKAILNKLDKIGIASGV
jgi:hypothetical protein